MSCDTGDSVGDTFTVVGGAWLCRVRILPLVHTVACSVCQPPHGFVSLTPLSLLRGPAGTFETDLLPSWKAAEWGSGRAGRAGSELPWHRGQTGMHVDPVGGESEPMAQGARPVVSALPFPH